MLSNRIVKWGIIGLGNIAHSFAQGLKVIPNAKLHAVASRSADKSLQFANHYNVKHALGSYEEITSIEDVDIIYIATPHNLHYENTLMCLEANKAVLCEKPFSVNYKQANKMIDKARENNTFLMEGLWTRFHPHVIKTLELLKDESMGNVQMIDANFSFRPPYNPAQRLFNPALAGGSLLDIGIYPVFIAYLFLGVPDNMHACMTKAQTGVDETMTMIFEYEHNKSASLYSSFAVNSGTEANIMTDNGVHIRMNKPFHVPTNLVISRIKGKSEHLTIPYVGNGYNYEALAAQNAYLDNKIECAEWNHSNTSDLIKILDQVRDLTGLKYPFE
jgi:predicted dehydrogenase